MNKTYIGIDPSINSTGVAVLEDNFYKFFRIAPSFTKKELSTELPSGENWCCEYIQYNKVPKSDLYYKNEIIKTQNLRSIVEVIKSICNNYSNKYIAMEGLSYGSSHTSAIYELAGLNYLIRDALIDSSLFLIPPTDLKKFAVGKGNADKAVICTAFSGLFPDIKQIKKYDDIADAFYLANIAKNIDI